MKGNLLLLFLFGFVIFSFGQSTERVIISGQITAPEGEDTEGISVYNTSSQLGVVTNESGEFQIAVAANDRLMIMALQFQKFIVIVDQGVVDTRQMRIYMNPAITQLDEVIVRPYDLSGNIRADLKKIKTAPTTVPWDLSWETLEFEYEFSDDENSAIRGNAAQEAFFNGQQQYAGVDVLGIVGMIFPKRKKEKYRDIVQSNLVTHVLLQRFGTPYIISTFEIPEDRVNDFIYFVEAQGVPLNLLKEENELQLLEFLFRQRDLYMARSE